MYCNIVHRLGNETGLESLKFQQDCAHSLGFKTTLLIPLRAMENDEVVNYFKSQAAEYGDEIGIHFHHIAGKFYREKFNNDETEVAVYLKPFEMRKQIITLIFEKFYELFGFYPVSIGGYYFDSQTLSFIKEKYPTVKIAIMSCFEEGVKMFAGCSHGWYLFSEGGPWTAYYPSKKNSLCPAKSADEAIDIIGLPHLSRDMLMSYVGRDDWFSSHTANMQRGRLNRGKECKYIYDFFDEWLNQDKFNDSVYYNFFVGSGWLNEGRNFEETSEDSRDLYRQSLEYCKKKSDEGRVSVLTMSEYAEVHNKVFKIGRGDAVLWHDLACGSKRSLCWYVDPHWRLAIDPNMGGAIVDLRPYEGRIEQDLGPGSTQMWNGSYPFALSYPHRNATLGSRIGCETGSAGFATRTEVESVNKNGDEITFVLKPFNFNLGNNNVCVQLSYTFNNNGEVYLRKKILHADRTDIEYKIAETFNGSFGRTQYPEDIAGVRLYAKEKSGEIRTITYEYLNRKATVQNALCVGVEIPMLNCKIELSSTADNASGSINEGAMFNPSYTFKLTEALHVGEESNICLKIKK